MKDEFTVGNAASVEVEAVNQNWLTTSPQNADKALDKINSITKVIDGAVRLALQRTKAQDWVLMGGKYYLQASGVEKITSVFGIYARNMRMEKEILEGGGYAYICSGEAGSKLLDSLYGETTIQIEGIRSSNDPFFAKGDRTVDPMDVRKAARANFLVRAAKAMLGFGNYSQEDLRKMGVQLDQVAAVTYQKGAEGGGNTNVISEAQQKRLFAISSKMQIGNNVLKDWLKAKYNIDSTSKILRKDYEAICNAVESGNLPAPKPLPSVDVNKPAPKSLLEAYDQAMESGVDAE